MPERVFIEHAATTMPSVLKEPLEIAAATSLILYETSASAMTSAGFQSVSKPKFIGTVPLITRWVSTPSASRSFSKSLTP